LVRNNNAPSGITIGRKLSKICINILLVEDNSAEARFLQEVLKGAMWNRFELLVATRLRDAIAHLQNPDQDPPFDLILLDLTLPDSQGLASLDALIKNAPNLPIVVLTNTNDDELAVEAVRHGAQDYLFKRQVNQDTLVRALRYAIERKQSEEELRDANETLELRVQERTIALEATNQRLIQEIAERQQIQQRLELAQKAGRIGSFEWHIPTHIVTWSAELEALYGQKVGGFENNLTAWLDRLHPDDRLHTETALWQTIATGQNLDTEFRILHPSDEVHWIAVKSSIFHDSTGNPLRMIGIHMDITEKKQLEAQFLQAQRLESLGTLASGISHDLNNVLTPILAVAQLLPLKHPHLDDQTQKMLRILEDSARRGSELIKQILFFARGVGGKRVILQLHHLLSEIEQIIRQTLPKSIQFATDIPRDTWLISGDATQLHQVFMNLWVNARDAMPEGGKLNITATNICVDEAYARRQIDSQPGAYVRVTVSDTGMGIPDKILHQIFDPFFTTKEFGKGTGLGLSAVMGIIKSHGGFVEVQSTIAQGSQFHVYLPATPALETIDPPSEDIRSGDRELVLVVDDEAPIREAVQMTLESYNYRVLTAIDGQSAIEIYKQHRGEIAGILIDLMMPIMDGLTAIAHLRQANERLYIVAMSGLDDIEVVSQAKDLGVQHFVPKPFTTQDLLQVLQEMTVQRSDRPLSSQSASAI
jgi:two-component system, cell cycle sensor histidine kinase and response regulator CckA